MVTVYELMSNEAMYHVQYSQSLLQDDITIWSILAATKYPWNLLLVILLIISDLDSTCVVSVLTNVMLLRTSWRHFTNVIINLAWL